MGKIIRYFLFKIIILASLFLNQCSAKTFSVAIDIGHSIKNPGAISARGVGEYYFNKNIALLLHSILQKQDGIVSFIINANGDDLSVKDRAEIGNQKKADLFISIHHDSVQPQFFSSWTYNGKNYLYSDRYHGYSIFYSGKNGRPKESLSFALILGKEMLKNNFLPTLHHAETIKGENRELVDRKRGVYQYDELGVLRNTRMPAVLLECGVIVNRDEETLLSDQNFQRKIAMAVVNAILSFKEEKKL